MDQTLKQRLRKRERKAAEALMNDSSLREQLNDDQAGRLLDWGFDLIEKQVRQTAALDDEAAGKKVAKTTGHIQEMMRLVNEMVDRFSAADESQASALYMRFLSELQYLQPVPITTMQEVKDAVNARRRLSRDGTFQHLITILKPDGKS